METIQKMSAEELQAYMEGLVKKGKAAQKIFERDYLTNRSVDEVLRAIGMEACDNAEELCQDALDETHMGNLQDKIGKFVSAAKIQWTVCKGQNTIDYEDCPGEPGVKYLPKPMGLIGAVMPSTNPVATIIGNAMMVLKGRNAIIIAPHPASVKVSVKMVNMLRAALKKVGAPEDLIQCVGEEAASIEATSLMMKLCDCNLATGGAGMVKAVYSSGKPGIGVGQGNTQELIDDDQTQEDIEVLVPKTIACRAMDNGVPCVGCQTDHLPKKLESVFVECMERNGAYVVKGGPVKDALRALVFPNGGTRINRDIVGKLPYQIGEMLGLDISKEIKVILIKNETWGDQDVLTREILCPIMRYTTYDKFEDGVAHAVANLENEGAGHTAAVWSHNDAHIEYAAKRVPVGRFNINQPTMGDNNGLTLSMTIGCGTWGGTSISENIAYYHLLNKTKVTVKLPNLRPFMDASWDDFEPFKRLLD